MTARRAIVAEGHGDLLWVDLASPQHNTGGRFIAPARAQEAGGAVKHAGAISILDRK